MVDKETVKGDLIFSREFAKTSLWFSGAIAGLALAFAAVMFGLGSYKAKTQEAELYKAAQATGGQISEGAAHFNHAAQLVDEAMPGLLDQVSQGIGDGRDVLGDKLPRFFDDTHKLAGTLSAGTEGLLAEAKTQLHQEGEDAHGILSPFKAVAPDVATNVKDASGSLAKAMKALDDVIEDPKVTAFIDDAIKRGTNILASVDTATKDVTFMTADGRAMTASGVGILDDFHGMTTDSKNKLHEIFYPAPVRGFWPNVKRIAGYVWQPVLEGGRIYFTLHALPVRLVK